MTNTPPFRVCTRRLQTARLPWPLTPAQTLFPLRRKQAANIPLVCELGIDKLSFDDFSLDVDAMITAALRMFMELGMVQKFKIDYEVSHTVQAGRPSQAESRRFCWNN